MSLSAPGASAAVAKNPLWVGGTGEVGVGKLESKGTGNSSFPREALLHLTGVQHAGNVCSVHLAPTNTVGRWVAGDL